MAVGGVGWDSSCNGSAYYSAWRYCLACGEKVDIHRKYCWKCGAVVKCFMSYRIVLGRGEAV